MARGIALWLAALALMVGGKAAAAELALKRVMLSTGGIGYFEYEARVEGDAAVSIDVPLDQVDDVLKSLVVYDSAGSAGEITLPGREPLQQSFADLPFNRDALQSAIDLLNALQGAEIRVAAPRAMSGRLVHVDQESIAGPGGVAETRPRVSVMTEQGLQQFPLHDADAINFADPKLQAQVATALERIAAYRDTGRRRLTLQLHGNGGRSVRVGYVVAAPLWKPTYRLSVDADPKAGTARLQGWAVLENFSGTAWHGVELTLLSGNPVTFRQALYESYYVPRQTVPVESGTHVLPPPDQGAIAMQAEAKPSASPPTQRYKPVGEPAPAAAAPAPPARIEAAGAVEEATQIAFTAPYPVDVAAGQSLVLPLLDRQLPVRRIDLYQPTTDNRHPLAALELRNDSATGLPAGVVTLYQQSTDQPALYLGDARLPAVPAGDKRLLSYAVDGKVTVDRSSAEQRPVVKATIAEGVMRINRMIRFSTDYRVKAAGAAAPTLLIEQPRRAGATLTAPDPKTIELTAGAYRIPLPLPPNGDTGVTVVEQQPIEDTVRLLDLDDERLGALVASTELDPKIHKALADLSARRQAVARQRAELKQLKDQRAQLVEDEKRQRDNLAALLGDPALHKRVLDKFNEIETAIETVSAAIARNTDALAVAERDLADYVAGLKL